MKWLHLLAGCLLASNLHAADSMKIQKDLPYAEIEGADPKSLMLDVYSPTSPGPHPVFVYVHGGGWKAGDKAQVGDKPAIFTAKGWSFVSINYRLLPAGRHPKNVEDVAAALAWVHDHIAESGGDPGRIFIMGHSAGAHLAALVATDEHPLKKAGKPLSIIKGVIPLDTRAYDVTRIPADAGAVKVFPADSEGQKDASPLHHVAAGKGIPPFLIAYSKGAQVVDVDLRRSVARDFQKKLNDAGIEATIAPAENLTHGQINQLFGTDQNPVTAQAWEFLKRLGEK